MKRHLKLKIFSFGLGKTNVQRGLVNNTSLHGFFCLACHCSCINFCRKHILIGISRPLSDTRWVKKAREWWHHYCRIVLAEKERRTGRKEHRRHRRKVITGSVYRWNKNQPIPYEFKSDDGKVTFPGSLCDTDYALSTLLSAAYAQKIDVCHTVASWKALLLYDMQ